MATKPDIGTSKEPQWRTLKTRQTDLSTWLPSLFTDHSQEWVKTAWDRYASHQTFVTQAISTVFAAETSSELRQAISGKLSEFRIATASAFTPLHNRDRILARVAPDEATLAGKLEDFDSATRGTQGE